MDCWRSRSSLWLKPWARFWRLNPSSSLSFMLNANREKECSTVLLKITVSYTCNRLEHLQQCALWATISRKLRWLLSHLFFFIRFLKNHLQYLAQRTPKTTMTTIKNTNMYSPRLKRLTQVFKLALSFPRLKQMAGEVLKQYFNIAIYPNTWS